MLDGSGRGTSAECALAARRAKVGRKVARGWTLEKAEGVLPQSHREQKLEGGRRGEERREMLRFACLRQASSA
jgi:hypothetical protein